MQTQTQFSNKDKRKAGQLARKAVKGGQIIKPDACTHCGKSIKLEMHHPDYARPLDVVWLCEKCHIQLHMKANGHTPRADGHNLSRPKNKLTPREIEVLKLACIGHKNKSIADLLKIGIRTVETHRERINRFARVSSPVQLVGWALARNLITPADIVAQVTPS